MVIWVAAGGRGTLSGSAFGAVLINYLKTIFTTGLPRALLAVRAGRLFILVTIFLPKGIIGTLSGFNLGFLKKSAEIEDGVAEPAPKPAE